MASKYSHYAAGGPRHGQGRDGRVVEQTRSRTERTQDEIPGFDGARQGLSHREPMNARDNEPDHRYAAPFRFDFDF